MSKKLHRAVALLFVASASLAAAVVACSGDDSAAPTGNSPDASTSDAPTTPTADVVQPDVAPTPTGKPPGCFSGTPTTNAQLMNACTDSQYVIVDNCARIGLCDGGALPPRVPPPVDAGSDAAPDAATGASDASADAANSDAAAAADAADAADAATD